MVKGTIAQIGDKDALVDIGGKSEALIALEELAGEDGQVTAKVGDPVEARVISIDGDLRISRRTIALSMRKDEAREILMEAFRNKIPVQGKVTASIKGGYEVQVASFRGFCPFSQIDVRRQEDPTLYFNKIFDFRIKDYNPRKNNLILSRRALIEIDAKKKEAEIRASIKPGLVIEGTVVSIQDFGAFIDLGASVQGLLHVSEISHTRVAHPRDLLQVGQRLRVQVLKQDKKKGKISLTRRPLEDDPWADAASRFKRGQVHQARVVRAAEFGAFLELAPGIDGLIHVSELKSLNKASSDDARAEDLVQIGDEVKVQVLSVDPKRRRVSLGLADESSAPGDLVKMTSIKVGASVTGKVERVEKFGVFLRLGPGCTGLIPNNELGTPRGADHKKMFSIGTEMTAEVIQADPSGRKIRLSVSKVAGREEREAIERYKRDTTSASLSTMAEAFKAFKSRTDEDSG